MKGYKGRDFLRFWGSSPYYTLIKGGERQEKRGTKIENKGGRDV